MNANELEKAANAINKRIDNLIKEYGRGSAAVKQYETMINANFRGATYTDKTGTLHISRSKEKLSGVSNSAAKFEKMFNAPTKGSVKAKATAQLKEQGIDNPTKEQIKAQVDLSDNAEQVINDNAYKYKMYDDPDLKEAEQLVTIRGRRKSWEEIDRIVEILKKDYSDREILEPENEFEGLKGVYR